MARFHKFSGGNMSSQPYDSQVTVRNEEQLSEINKRQADELFKLRDIEKQNIALRKENEALAKKLAHNTDVWKLVGQLMQLVEYKETM
jgi:hypothetical protein